MERTIADNYIGKDENEPVFYYHSDHLGSASYVTNGDGKVTQTLNYLPYGEDWVDLQNFSEMPAENNLGVYKFNGKEKDAESGYNYYGARYYDSEKLSWLSVDPMSDKYPSLSPYVYCADNPVKLIDPNGMEWDTESDKKQANEIKELICVRQKEINNRLSKISQKIQKITRKSRIEKLTREQDDLNAQKELLSSLLTGINDIEKEEDIKYTFKDNDKICNTLGSDIEKIIINYNGMANKIHELTHAIQYEHRNNWTILQKEENAYSTQYAFDNASFSHYNASYYITSVKSINAEWLKSLHFFDYDQFNRERTIYPYKDKIR
ncbi:MAG: RHS repeat-associated core domain-containing protein [Bacteroidales bacterium]|jgi:RHS repeat-associated protein|nr:RHS repeat-associated core domain-containing protein [Bacteroidales bacterium]